MMSRHEYERWEELSIQREQTSLLARGDQRLAILQGGVEMMAARLQDQGGGMAWEVGRLREQLSTQERTAAEGHAQTASGLADLKSELASGFAGLDTLFYDLGTVLESGLAEIARLLAEMNQKLDWSDEYRRFLSFKRNAFDLTIGGEPLRAIGQGLAGLGLRTPGCAADDRIERDPELCLLVANLVLFHQPLDYDGPDVERLAENARRRGRIVNSKASLAAAAGGCQILAIAARARGDEDEAIDLEFEGLFYEPGDQVAALARTYASALWGWQGEDVAYGVAVFSVLFARFFPLWLLEPATLARQDTVTAVGLEVARTLTQWDAELLQADLDRRAFWKATAPTATSRKELQAPAPVPRGHLPMTDLAASVRARMRHLGEMESQLGNWLGSQCHHRAQQLVPEARAVIETARANWAPVAASLDHAVREARANLQRVQGSWFATTNGRAKAQRAVDEAEADRRARTAAFEASVSHMWSAAETKRKRLLELHGALFKAPPVVPRQLSEWSRNAGLQGLRSFEDLQAVCDAAPEAWRAPPAAWDDAVKEGASLLTWKPAVGA
jgi:hypothetical protein